MKTLSRQEVKEHFQEIVEKYGKPKAGEIYIEEQLIAKIAYDLCAYDETNIIYEHGEFNVSPSLVIKREYAPDHTFIGTVKAEEWYTKEQRKAMHEVAFGYKF